MPRTLKSMNNRLVAAIETVRVELARGRNLSLDVEMMARAGYTGEDRGRYEDARRRHHQVRDELLAEHRRLLAELRADPEALTHWVTLHRRAIDALCVRWRSDEKYYATNLMVARDTLAEWDQLLRGE